MNIPKDVFHEPKPAAKALITTTLINKERHTAGVEYTEGIEYIENIPQRGKMIEPYEVLISRATSELSGAFPFLFEVISFVLTHKEYQGGYESLKTGFYDSIVLPLGIFLDIALDKTKGVKDLLMSELVKLEKSKPSKVVPFDEKTSVYGQPIVVAIGKDKTEYVKNIDREKYDNNTLVQILYMKCFFRNERGHIQEPKAIYAKLIESQVKYIKAIEQGKARQAGKIAPIVNVNIDTDPYAQTSAINRVREFLLLHDNGKSTTIRYNVFELLRHSQPQYIRQSGRSKGMIWHKEEAMSFLFHALTVIQFAYQTEHTGRRITGFTLGTREAPPFLEVTFSEED
jgi:hypothetical protein